MSDTLRNYVRDLGVLLRQRALDAKLDRDASVDCDDEDLKLGRLMAFYEVLSLMVEQAAAFGVDPEAIGLDGFDPEAELL